MTTTAGRTCSLDTARLTCHHGVTTESTWQSISDDDGDGEKDADAQEATTAKVRSLPELLLQNFICSGS